MKDDTISRTALLDAVESVDWYHQNKNGEMVHGANSDEHQAWYKADDIYKAIESVLPAQPECEDTISRSHFDERVRLAGGISEEELTDDFKDGVLTVLEMLRTEPPVTPKQPGWIPCSDALPSEYDQYLITTENGMVVFGVYDPKEEQWSRYDSIKSLWLYGIKVLAWQPLLKPWEGEGHE